jgi:hypothetical protein
VFGGRDSRGSNDELWILNIDSSSWILLQSSPPFASPTFGSSMLALSDSRLFLFGGFNSNNVAVSDAWILNVNVTQPSALWHYLDALAKPPARGFHGCIGAPVSSVQRISDVFYIHGGIGSGEIRNDNLLQDFWSCRLISKGMDIELSCRPLLFASALPICSQCISVMIADVVLVHGGQGLGSTVRSDTNLLFLSTMRIETILNPGSDKPTPRSGAVMVHFNRVDDTTSYLFLFGGVDSNDLLLSDTWLFDISKSRYVPCIFPNNLHRV